MIGHEFVTLRDRNFQIFELVVKKQGKTAHYKGQKNNITFLMFVKKMESLLLFDKSHLVSVL